MNSFSVMSWDNVSEDIIALFSPDYEFPCEKLSLAIEYCQSSRFLSECHQLYQLFDWNWQQFKSNIICDQFDNISDAENKKET